MDNAFVAAVLTEGAEILKVLHLGRRFKSEQRTALQGQDPICDAKGCSNRLGLEYDHFEDGALTHTTRVGAAKRFCSTCHAKKTAGWHVSPPDEYGRCTFTPPGGQPSGQARAPTLDPTTQRDLITQIRDNAERPSATVAPPSPTALPDRSGRITAGPRPARPDRRPSRAARVRALARRVGCSCCGGRRCWGRTSP